MALEARRRAQKRKARVISSRDSAKKPSWRLVLYSSRACLNNGQLAEGRLELGQITQKPAGFTGREGEKAFGTFIA